MFFGKDQQETRYESTGQPRRTHLLPPASERPHLVGKICKKISGLEPQDLPSRTLARANASRIEYCVLVDGLEV